MRGVKGIHSATANHANTVPTSRNWAVSKTLCQCPHGGQHAHEQRSGDKVPGEELGPSHFPKSPVVGDTEVEGKTEANMEEEEGPAPELTEFEGSTPDRWLQCQELGGPKGSASKVTTSG